MSKIRLGQNWDVIMQGEIGASCSWPPEQVSPLRAPRRAGSVENVSEAGSSFAATESRSRSIILSGGLSFGVFRSLEGAGA